MATLTVQQVVLAGLLSPAFAAAAGGGDDFPNDSSGVKTFVYIKNGDGSATSVTFDDTVSSAPEGADAFDADVTIVVPATDEAIVGPFPVARFGTSVPITYTSVTSLTIAVLQLPL